MSMDVVEVIDKILYFNSHKSLRIITKNFGKPVSPREHDPWVIDRGIPQKKDTCSKL